MSAADLGLFLAAALVLAVMPGPGMLYVGARALAGGLGEGLASTAGTGLGGMVHVVAGALGLSAIVMASAEAFVLMKLLGGFYLIWLGVQAWRQARLSLQPGAELPALGMLRAFREGVVVEALNPKTAAFFLAFVPQFLDPARRAVVAPAPGRGWLDDGAGAGGAAAAPPCGLTGLSLLGLAWPNACHAA